MLAFENKNQTDHGIPQPAGSRALVDRRVSVLLLPGLGKSRRVRDGQASARIVKVFLRRLYEETNASHTTPTEDYAGDALLRM